MPNSGDDTTNRGLSVRIEPFWLNPATIKGTTAILLGSFVLFASEISARFVSLSIGVALIVAGVSDFRFAGPSGEGVKRRAFEGVLSIGAGVFFLMLPSETVRILAVAGGI